MTRLVTDLDFYRPYPNAQVHTAARDTRSRGSQHTRTQQSQMSQDYRVSKSKSLSRNASPRKHGQVSRDRAPRHISSCLQQGFDRKTSIPRHVSQHRDRTINTTRPSSWHSDTMHDFYHPNAMPAFSATNVEPDQNWIADFSQYQGHTNQFYAPTYGTQSFLTSVTNDCPHMMPAVVGQDGLLPVPMYQPYAAHRPPTDWQGFDPNYMTFEHSWQDAETASIDQYAACGTWQQYTPSEIPETVQQSALDTLFDEKTPDKPYDNSSEEVEAVQEELVGLGLYNDGPSKISSTTTYMQSAFAPKTAGDQPFLLGERWQPPDHHKAQEREEDASSPGEDFSYLDMLVDPAVYQSQQTLLPSYREVENLQQNFTYPQGLRAGGYHWPMEQMNMITGGYQPSWERYGTHYPFWYCP